MNNAAELVVYLRKRGVHLWTDREQLHYYCTREGTLKDADIAALRRLRPDLIGLLAWQSCADALRGPIKISHSGIVPLSIQQEILWNIRDKFNLVPKASLKISGLLDSGVLKFCLSILMHRHASLRTGIIEVNGEPAQRIDDKMTYELNIVDLSARTQQDAEREAKQLAEEFFAEEISLDATPLFKIRLLRISKCAHVLAVAISHAISDGTSVELLLRELRELYDDYLEHRSSNLSESKIQYADYALWQRASRPFWQRKNEDYWTSKLLGTEPIDVSMCRVLEPIEPLTAFDIEVSIGAKLSQSLRQLAREQRTFPAMLVLAVFAMVVSRWCRQDNFAVGSVFAGRDVPGCEGIVGFMAQPYMLQIHLNRRYTFLDFLRYVEHEFRSSLEHLECGVLVRNTSEIPDLGPVPMCQWLPWSPRVFSRENPNDRETVSRRALKIEPFPVVIPPGFYGRGGASVELRFFDRPEGICGTGYYRADLFSKRAIEDFSRSIQWFCELVVSNPLMRVSTLLDECPD